MNYKFKIMFFALNLQNKTFINKAESKTFRAQKVFDSAQRILYRIKN